MLHKINFPNCRNQLELIVQFQRQVLEMVCDANMVFPITEKNESQVKQRFINQDIAKWLWEKLWNYGNPKNGKSKFHKTLEEAIKSIRQLQNSQSIGQSIFDAFNNDIKFFLNLNEHSFQFKFQILSIDINTQNSITNLMQSFYEEFSKSNYPGFPKCIHQGQEENFHRYNFLESFLHANNNLGVCPACDRRRPGLNGWQVDHFFPQSKYPFLSVHPFNLIPICSECNLTSCKGDKDPVDINNNDSLIDTFHPYEKPAIENIKVEFSRDSNAIPQISIIDNQGMPSKRVDNLNRLIQLQQRWTHELSQEIESIRGRIADKNKELNVFDKTNNEKILDCILYILETELEHYKSNIGKQAYSIISYSYVKHALFDDNELYELVNQFLGE